MTSLNKAFRPALFCMLFSALCMETAFSAFRGQPLAEGLWGGEHIRMDVTAAETKIEFDCAHATIPSRVLIDPRGRFDVKGAYFEEHGGPTRQGDEGKSYPVQFSGTVKGKDMKLAVRRTDTRELLDTFRLTHGREPELVKCR